jgi:hypothetical protein
MGTPPTCGFGVHGVEKVGPFSALRRDSSAKLALSRRKRVVIERVWGAPALARLLNRACEKFCNPSRRRPA